MATPPGIDRIITVLVDAADLGDKAAAARHKVSARTLRRWRLLHGNNPEITSRVAALNAALVVEWLDAAKASRLKVLARVEELVALAQVDQLRDVVGALKIIADSILAEQVVKPDGQVKPDGRQPHAGAGVARTGGAGAAAARAAGRLGDAH